MKINSVAPDAAFKRNVINGGRGEEGEERKRAHKTIHFTSTSQRERDPYPVRLFVRLSSISIVVLPRRRRSSSIVVGDKLKGEGEEGRRTEEEMEGTLSRLDK